MITPWGIADSTENWLADGSVIWVSTPSHGGIGLTLEVARKLSTEAQRIGQGFGTRTWFEEDCDWTIPVYEMPALAPAAFKSMKLKPDEWGPYLEKSIANWHPEYAILKGIITPDHMPVHAYHSGPCFDEPMTYQDNVFKCSRCGYEFGRLPATPNKRRWEFADQPALFPNGEQIGLFQKYMNRLKRLLIGN